MSSVQSSFNGRSLSYRKQNQGIKRSTDFGKCYLTVIAAKGGTIKLSPASKRKSSSGTKACFIFSYVLKLLHRPHLWLLEHASRTFDQSKWALQKHHQRFYLRIKECPFINNTLCASVEKLRLLSKLESAGLLSALEKGGFTLSKIEKAGLLTTAEKLGVLSATGNRFNS